MNGSCDGPATTAYRYCEFVTRRQARNFAYGIRLLPPPRRRAVAALYAFARRVDDTGDGELPLGEKRARLAQDRKLLHRLRSGRVDALDTDPVAVALADACHRFPIPLPALDELIDGVERDLRGDRYETWGDLAVYCRCVAGSVGRLCLAVFGCRPGRSEDADAYANTLGLALQLTNILRDIREDAGRGRVYLPAEDLAKFRCSDGFDDLDTLQDSDFLGLMDYEVQRARGLFRDGYRLLPLLDRRSAACVATMAGIYDRLLDRIAADPQAVLRGRLSLTASQKTLVAVRGLTGPLLLGSPAARTP
jgi:15-cis-phytoene synthase